MTTWNTEPKHEDGLTFGDGYFGYGPFGGGSSWTAVSQDDSSWSAESQDE